MGVTRYALAALLLAIAPAHAQRAEAPAAGLACAASAKPMARVDLMFGMARKSGGVIGESQWRAFLAEEVTPRFPDGLTVLAGHGQWRGADKRLVREPMRMVLVLFEPGADSSTRIEAIREAYKRRFSQDSVMRIDSGACVSF